MQTNMYMWIFWMDKTSEIILKFYPKNYVEKKPFSIFPSPVFLFGFCSFSLQFDDERLTILLFFIRVAFNIGVNKYYRRPLNIVLKNIIRFHYTYAFHSNNIHKYIAVYIKYICKLFIPWSQVSIQIQTWIKHIYCHNNTNKNIMWFNSFSF